MRETLEAERARALDRVARRERKIDGLLKRLEEADARTIAAESAQVRAEGKLTDLEDRMAVLSALEAVDYVVVFEEDTPEDLLREIRPEVLVKGSEYEGGGVVGREIVEGYGGGG